MVLSPKRKKREKRLSVNISLLWATLPTGFRLQNSVFTQSCAFIAKCQLTRPERFCLEYEFRTLITGYRACTKLN